MIDHDQRVGERARETAIWGPITYVRARANCQAVTRIPRKTYGVNTAETLPGRGIERLVMSE